MKNGAFDFVSKPVDIRLLRNLVTQAVKVRGGAESPIPSAGAASPVALSAGTGVSSAGTQDRAESVSQQEKDLSAHAGMEVPSLSALSGRRQPVADTTEQIGRGRLIGRSEPMQALRKMISKVARTNAPVWITGESGTGKELIARLIHENGPRCDAPFVAINCGAIPSELMESEMFGHRKGSFTGAHTDHDGLFRRAQGGTLFLDEVAELPLHMQVKLLRAIQERTIRPVGSSDEISTDVRVLSASHKDLAVEVEQGRFRHDLYYRLNVICIQSPCLRQRSEDVPDIARHILKSVARSEGLDSPASLTPAAEDLLCRYAFPGNVRELENILERAIAMTDDGVIDAEDLNIELDTSPHSTRVERLAVGTAANESSERQAILDALSQTRWNRKAAAMQLGMTYRQLRYRIQQYGIDEDRTGT
jgi:two-component system response regulator PilR (NtrC family)